MARHTKPCPWALGLIYEATRGARTRTGGRIYGACALTLRAGAGAAGPTTCPRVAVASLTGGGGLVELGFLCMHVLECVAEHAAAVLRNSLYQRTGQVMEAMSGTVEPPRRCWSPNCVAIAGPRLGARRQLHMREGDLAPLTCRKQYSVS